MHVKWKRRRYTTKGYGGYANLRTGEVHEYREALVVRAVRVNGQPRQEVIARLGSFTMGDLAAGQHREQEMGGAAAYWDRDNWWAWIHDPRYRLWLTVEVILYARWRDEWDQWAWGGWGAGRGHIPAVKQARRALADEPAFDLPATRARIEAQLEAVIPRPPESVLEPVRREMRGTPATRLYVPPPPPSTAEQRDQ